MLKLLRRNNTNMYFTLLRSFPHSVRSKIKWVRDYLMCIGYSLSKSHQISAVNQENVANMVEGDATCIGLCAYLDYHYDSECRTKVDTVNPYSNITLSSYIDGGESIDTYLNGSKYIEYNYTTYTTGGYYENNLWNVESSYKLPQPLLYYFSIDDLYTTVISEVKDIATFIIRIYRDIYMNLGNDGRTLLMQRLKKWLPANKQNFTLSWHADSTVKNYYV